MKKFLCTLMPLLFLVGMVHGQTPKSAKRLFDEGTNFLNQKKFPEALEAFKASAKLDSRQPAIPASIGVTLLALGRPVEAISAFREAIRLAPQDGTFQTALCGALTSEKKYTEAIEVCKEGVRLNSTAPKSYAALITTMRAANRPAADIQSLIDSSVNQFTDSELLLSLAASYYFESGNYSHSAELYERLLQLNDKSSYYHARLACAFVRLERDADALANARKALEVDPNNPFAHYAMGMLFFELGQNEEAANAFQKISETIAELPDAPYFLAESEIRLGQNAQAIEILRKLVQRFPVVFEYQKELGRQLAEQGNDEEAIPVLKRAVELKPDNIEVLAGLGLAYSGLAQFDESIAVLEKAQKLYPGNQVIEMLLSVNRARREAVSQIPQIKADLEKDPTNLQIRLYLAEILIYAHKIVEADTYISDILKSNPKDVKIYIRLTTILSEANEFDKALAICQKALETEENPNSYLGLASMYKRLGRFEEASSAFAKVIELKPDTPNIMKIYADLLRDNGKRREALDMYKRSLAIVPLNPPALYNAGLLSAKLGDSNSALKYLETLKTVDPALAKKLQRCLLLKIWQ